MASSSASASAVALLLLVLFFFSSSASAQLSPTFYNTSCPNAISIIRRAVMAAVKREPRMAASLLRLHFHDCFGCDGSLLLDDTSTFTGEKTANPNNNSLRGFEVIDRIKSSLESACKQVVSCADILAVAARDSVVAVGGPSWGVELGRRDSTTASLSSANTDIPGPTSNLSTLISSFTGKGLSIADMVALSGAHTIGKARCTMFRTRIYNETNIDSSFACLLRLNCSMSGGGDNALSSLDMLTPTMFDSNYYVDLVNMKGLLHSDQELYNGGLVDSQVVSYSNDSSKFFSDFANAMVLEWAHVRKEFNMKAHELARKGFEAGISKSKMVIGNEGIGAQGIA
ncbi:cationic peroxidase 1-like [Canna indica]|uniref:Peroxidase n=1 Tax=Canna indica TaxID=4628 RepID=A0AAQ3QDL9_9LILI|nr:cationic peroxidase 1-like [Canna indica]